MQDASDRARRIAEQQERVTDEVGRPGWRDRRPADRRGSISSPNERTNWLNLSRSWRPTWTDWPPRLDPSSLTCRDRSGMRQGSIRSNKLKEKIRYSREIIRGRSPEYAQNFEREISDNVDELVEAMDAGVRVFQPDG